MKQDVAKQGGSVNTSRMEVILDGCKIMYMDDRIAERTKQFNYEMAESEKEAMAQLLSDIGVKTSDLIDVSNLADNYAINAEIVTPSDYQHYNMKLVKDEALFSWKEDGETFYCLTW